MAGVQVIMMVLAMVIIARPAGSQPGFEAVRAVTCTNTGLGFEADRRVTMAIILDRLTQAAGDSSLRRHEQTGDQREEVHLFISRRSSPLPVRPSSRRPGAREVMPWSTRPEEDVDRKSNRRRGFEVWSAMTGAERARS